MSLPQPSDNIVVQDISEGRELHPIPVINNINGAKPDGFSYVTVSGYSDETKKLIENHQEQGCGCKFDRDNDYSCGINCACEQSSLIQFDPKHRIVINPEKADFYEHFYVECGRHCECRGKCKRQINTDGKSHKKLFMKYMKHKGFGVFAGQPIAVGMPISEFVGEVFIKQSEGEGYPEGDYQQDLLWNPNHHFILEALRVGNISRFFNHSCFPTLIPIVTYSSIPTPERIPPLPRCIFIACRDIIPGMELTFDYRPSYFHDRKKPCRCYEYYCVIPPADWNEKSKTYQETADEIENNKAKMHQLWDQAGDIVPEEIVLD